MYSSPCEPGLRVRILLGGKETGGRVALIEACALKGVALPRHIHHEEDVAVYVAQGEVICYRGDTSWRASTGTCVSFPAGIEHCLRVVSPEARLLALVMPAGLEGVCSELTARADQSVIERMIAIAARYGIEITGPAPTSDDEAESESGS